VSDKVRLLQDGYDKSIPKSGLLVYHPVFDSENKNLLGVVTGVIRSTVYFEELITKTATELEMSVRVEDLGFDASDDPFLFQSENWDRISGKVISRTIQLPNRQWRIDFKLSDAVSAWERSILTGTTIAGLLIAFLISYIVNLQSREKERLAEMLDIKTVELKRMAELDPLTQLLNRRVFNDNLLNQINSGKPFSLVGFDIDHFKKVNDTYGHPTGDEVIRRTSALLRKTARSSDICGRFGGEEFTVLLPHTNQEQACYFAERLRKRIEQEIVKVEDFLINYT
ncbi:sensor domain-containing diguanylate cyclase, partial [Vibrio sp. 1641]|uniref:sensor domain-containing diguanylate cyclase n=1 Tax=Vibrio sp. 1641 TaxID=3074571 RepID=UPI0029646743